jgi:hypothetical protein
MHAPRLAYGFISLMCTMACCSSCGELCAESRRHESQKSTYYGMLQQLPYRSDVTAANDPRAKTTHCEACMVAGGGLCRPCACTLAQALRAMLPPSTNMDDDDVGDVSGDDGLATEEDEDGIHGYVFSSINASVHCRLEHPNCIDCQCRNARSIPEDFDMSKRPSTRMKYKGALKKWTVSGAWSSYNNLWWDHLATLFNVHCVGAAAAFRQSYQRRQSSKEAFTKQHAH